MSNLRPMLAGKAPEDLERLRYPLLASAKLDGIRCLISNGQAVTRTLKPIPNHYIRSILSQPEFNGLDGEIIIGSASDPNCMQHTSSGVMSYDGEPDFAFYVFDKWNRTVDFETIQWSLASQYSAPFLIAHPHVTIGNYKQLESFEEEVLEAGYEGLILRDPRGPYKFNRSTTREGWMLKLKRFDQNEAVIIGFEELFHNDNEPTLDERGYTKRATRQDFLSPGGMLGAFFCKMLHPETKQPLEGSAFSVGSGFTTAQRAQYWKNREDLFGRIITFKHFAKQGVLHAPRHPIFIGFRDERDL